MGNKPRHREHFPKMNARGNRRRAITNLIRVHKEWLVAQDRLAALIYVVVLRAILDPTPQHLSDLRFVQQTIPGRTLAYLPEFGAKLGRML